VRNLQFTAYDGEKERESGGGEGDVSRKRTDEDVVKSQTYIVNRNR